MVAKPDLGVNCAACSGRNGFAEICSRAGGVKWSKSLPSNFAASSAQQPLHLSYAKLPLGFELNQGQSDKSVKFLARGSGYGLFLTQREAVLMLQSAKYASLVRMRLSGGDLSAPMIGSNELPGKSNYFIGNNPAKWHRNVPQFARVRYQHVYPGTDRCTTAIRDGLNMILRSHLAAIPNRSH